MFSYFSPVNNNNVNGVEFQFDCNLSIRPSSSLGIGLVRL